MEEFKNLKEIIELSEEEINNNDAKVSAILDLEDLKELRNLLARYKELEKENKILKSKQTKIITDSFHEKMAQKFNEEFITKKRVKEKIEELEKEIEEKQENGTDFTLIHEHEIDTNGIIQVLQELIED